MFAKEQTLSDIINFTSTVCVFCDSTMCQIYVCRNYFCFSCGPSAFISQSHICTQGHPDPEIRIHSKFFHKFWEISRKWLL